jgi:hypothetical protein
MIRIVRASVFTAALAGLAAAGIASAQSESSKPAAPGMHGGMQEHGMGGMMGMMQGCPMMQGGGMMRGGSHAMPHLPPGNEKLELQMHADMMRAMADVLSKYAGRLPDKR